MSEVTVGSIRTTINSPLAGGIYEALLEKAERERDEALEELAEWKNAAEHVKADHPDEVHCGCVKVLRKLLTDVKRERDEAREESKRLEAICVSVHDRLLRGDDDSGLLKILEEAWQKAARHKEAAK